MKRSGTPPPLELRLISSNEERIQHREGVRRLYCAMNEMPTHYRIAFGLFALDGRSLQGVAEATGVSLMAVKTRLWRARRMLNKAAQRDPVLAGYLQSTEV
jgi:DNA-directed RNA polymerase specialized sigma24 family protein